MEQMVVGVFNSPAAAHSAEERLVGRGIDPAALHFATRESEAAREGGMPSGLRDFLAELFGTEHSEEAGHYSEAIREGSILLAVDVPAGAPLDMVRKTLLDAGAVDVDERVSGSR